MNPIGLCRILKFGGGAHWLTAKSLTVQKASCVRNQDTLGSDRHRCADRAWHHLGGDTVDSLAPRFSAATWPALVPDCAGIAGLSPSGVLLVVVRLRRLCATDLPGRRWYCRIRRLHLNRGRGRHVGVAGSGEPHQIDLPVAPVGGTPRKYAPPAGPAPPRGAPAARSRPSPPTTSP